jgi:hypothetical protein
LSSQWTSTSAKIDGQWKVVGLHLSSNVFTNPLMDEAKAAIWYAATGCLAGGFILAGSWRACAGASSGGVGDAVVSSAQPMRTACRNTGAERHTESRRSSMPPWPRIIVPQSLMPRLRLSADIIKPPANPSKVMTNERIAASATENGVIGASRAPSAVADPMPPTKPSTVFDGDSRGAISRLPRICPRGTGGHRSLARRG